MAVPNRILQYQDPEESRARSLAAFNAALKTNRPGSVRLHDVRDPLTAGDPASESGVKVAFSELDAELQALIIAGGAGGLRVRELDGSPDVQPVDDIRVPNGSIVQVAGSSIRLLFAEFAGSFETATIGTGDITTGTWGFWYDTVNNQQWLVRNRGGTLFFVELTC